MGIKPTDLAWEVGVMEKPKREGASGMGWAGSLGESLGEMRSHSLSLLRAVGLCFEYQLPLRDDRSKGA